MENLSLVIRGRSIGDKELEEIRALVQKYWPKGRAEISRQICHLWDWKQPNGWLKDRACRDMLLTLEKKGLISLPKRKNPGPQGKKNVQTQGFLIDTSVCKGSITDYSSLTFSMVRKSSKEKLWDHLVRTHHYLGKPFIVGSYLKYIAYLDGQIVACIGWGSAAWKVNDRDQFIGWDQQTRKRNLHLIAGNVRFLILPWVQVPHLASKILAANAKLLKKDWLDFYNVPLALLETFVDTSRFYGTCYKAANWIHVGITAGSAKRGASYHYHGQSKAVFVYPLDKKFRERLHG